MTLESSPFQLLGSGWGFFTINVLVLLKGKLFWHTPIAKTAPGGQDRGMLLLTWTLNFEQPSTQSTSSFEIGTFSAANVVGTSEEIDEEL
jgi:hypothetical protein